MMMDPVRASPAGSVYSERSGHSGHSGHGSQRRGLQQTGGHILRAGSRPPSGMSAGGGSEAPYGASYAQGSYGAPYAQQAPSSQGQGQPYGGAPPATPGGCSVSSGRISEPDQPPVPVSAGRSGRLSASGMSMNEVPMLEPYTELAENIPTLRKAQPRRTAGPPEGIPKAIWSDSVAHLGDEPWPAHAVPLFVFSGKDRPRPAYREEITFTLREDRYLLDLLQLMTSRDIYLIPDSLLQDAVYVWGLLPRTLARKTCNLLDAADVHAAIASLDKGLFPKAFCKIVPDYLTGSEDHCIVMHADGAGTKSSLAYAYWRRTGDLSVWRGIAQDALVMNLDDLICVGVCGQDPIMLSSTIGRNKNEIPREVIAALIEGTERLLEELKQHGVHVVSTGGETADVGDLVRTIIVDSTVTARAKRSDIIDNGNIRAGDVVVGLASYGQATYETEYNSGMGSNGLTAARHDVFSSALGKDFPQTFDPALPAELVYCGQACSNSQFVVF
ncbi:unnamed protein product [Polarella glacialis]|uniref:PurM-like N-terminal domain-containing protein n=1 Tax=Polarella glacialis TaxID=89957 RepID=A0A813KUU9_POLGL|nr:unnamed protein product [Polarella glacialis]